MPVWANSPNTMNVALRTTLPTTTLSKSLEQSMRDIDPTVPIVRLRSMDDVFSQSIERPRLLADLLGVFASLALALSAIGTFGVLSYTVAERRREIGVRMALGASGGVVLREIMKASLLLTVLGLIAGLAGELALNRLISSLLFGVRPTDPTTLAAVIGMILLVGTLSCWIPALRATKVDPMVALRYE